MTKMENAPNAGASSSAVGAPYKSSQMASNRNLKSRGGLSANWKHPSMFFQLTPVIFHFFKVDTFGKGARLDILQHRIYIRIKRENSYG